MNEKNDNCKISSAESQAAYAFDKFFNVIKRLRAPDGCPWDKVQTPLTMRSDLIEETFEAVEAVSNCDSNHAKEELGDVLLNTIMIAYMYEQQGCFNVADSISELTEKLIRRHPHVFKESEGHDYLQKDVKTPEQVLNQWDKIKRGLEGREQKSVLDEVPEGFPPILKAFKFQKKAAKQGFDWSENDVDAVFKKVDEEIQEVKEAFSELKSECLKATAEEVLDNPLKINEKSKVCNSQLHLEEEIGDVLFSIVNLARHLKVDPSVALSRANSKFYKRYTFIEQKMQESGLPMDSEHLGDMDKFWNEAKKPCCP